MGRVFAQLTAMLEDAAAVASYGQNPNLSLRRRSALMRRIVRLLQKAIVLIDSVTHPKAADSGAER